MGGGGEGGAVADLDQDRAAAEETVAGHRGQDPGKRVVIGGPFHVFGDRFRCWRVSFRVSASLGRIVSAAWVPGTTTVCSSRAVRILSTSRVPMRGACLTAIAVSFRLPAFANPGWSAAAGEDLEDRRMGDVGSEDPFEPDGFQ